MIQICQILSKENLVFICINIALLLLLFDVLAQITKKGEIEREMCPWAISIIVLVIRCPIQRFELLYAKRARSANQRKRYASRLSKLFLSTNMFI
jgi:hypothetical protein